ncbi:MAG: bifunctional diaminohydroxyphosphoribosylaminopyrimidine deaminase/5-amino-6-(5-phosphoribosylamino)uracil reductase RibD [Oscillospiraceae bacterium]|nr:bifunctional diaminohydroxyphosphoribosylaminopyrimidine deaminase/5-amino-6-(5-phosphoribosylamino)uracil reductase RibD [Oscillospiraceae bacterium]
MNTDETYMLRAVSLAKKGLGFVNPNPLVGAVLVKNGTIIGEGFHSQYGKEHAERQAFQSCLEPAEGATLYVTLEPCCHQGKQPPCTDLIIAHKIAKVVVGSMDPNPLVAGKGILLLRQHGIQVVTGVLKGTCDSLNEIFFHYITTGRPFVILKYAMTADGKIATVTGRSQWITGEGARHHVHETRKRVAAVMVGIGTVLADDPILNCRLEHPQNPVRVVCDSHLRIPLHSKIVQTAKEIPTIVATLSREENRKKQLQDLGVTVLQAEKQNQRIDLMRLMERLGKWNLDSVLLEGGAELNYSALECGIISKAQVYIAPKLFGGALAKSPLGGAGVQTPAEAYLLSQPSVSRLGEDLLLEFKLGGTKTCSPES